MTQYPPVAMNTTTCNTLQLHINNSNLGAQASPAATGFVCHNIFAAIDGTTINGVITQTGPPFQITHISDDDGVGTTTGFKLNYAQAGGC